MNRIFRHGALLEKRMIDWHLFWSNVDRTGGNDACWPWTGKFRPDGRGRIWFDNQHWFVNRLAYESVKGPIPRGKAIGNSCGMKHCCNPGHWSVRFDKVGYIRPERRKKNLVMPELKPREKLVPIVFGLEAAKKNFP